MNTNNPGVKITIFHPFDIFGSKVGGIPTVIRSFIKHAPPDFDIELVGVTEDKKARPLGVVGKLSINEKQFKNIPILHEPDPNRRTPVPLMLRFVAKLIRSRINVKGRILEFHRIEESIPFWHLNNHKLLFVHCFMNDVFSNPLSESKWMRLPGIYIGLEKLLIPKMTRIYSESGTGIDSYRKSYPLRRDRFRFLPTWADDDIFYPSPAEEKRDGKKRVLAKYGFPEAARLIYFSGRLEKQKNPMLLLRTFQYIHSVDPLTRLLVNGEGSLQGTMERYIAESNLRHKVVLELTPQKEMAEVMRLSDIFLLTSDFEGMPMSVLEALASGLPVVTTATGEVRRVVRVNSGIVIDSDRPVALGNAVLEVLNQPERFGGKACLEAVQDYLPRTVLEPVYNYHYDLAGGEW